MAAIEYVWQKVEHKDIEDCVRWCQNKLNLRDWQITIDTGVKCPKAFNDKVYDVIARCHSQPRRLTAFLWFPLGYIEIRRQNALQAVCHEMLHILCADVRIAVEDEDEDNVEDCLIFTLESSLFELYCYETGRKIPKVLDYWGESYGG